MFCYKDRTYCASPNCEDTCGRKLTPQIIKEANKWWKDSGCEGEAPIAISYFCGDKNG